MYMKTPLAEINRKTVKFDKRIGVYKNGENNDYPDYIEACIENSITATSCSDRMVQYIVGKGFGDVIDKIKIGDSTLISIVEDIAKSVADYRGVFIHANYNAGLSVSDFDAVDYKQYRLGKRDSNDYSGKIVYAENWHKVKVSDLVLYNVLNPNPAILTQQIETAGGIEKFLGQIKFYSQDRNKVYPNARIHSTYLDCDTEHQNSIFLNVSIRDGFQGATMVFTPPLNTFDETGLSPDEKEEKKRQANDERKNVKSSLKELKGAENNNKILHVEVKVGDNEKLSDHLHIENIDERINDKMFESAASMSRGNIAMSYCNIPKVLIEDADNSFFGSSGSMYQEAQLIYMRNTSRARDFVESITNEMCDLLDETHPIKAHLPLRLIPLVVEKQQTNE